MKTAPQDTFAHMLDAYKALYAFLRQSRNRDIMLITELYDEEVPDYTTTLGADARYRASREGAAAGLTKALRELCPNDVRILQASLKLSEAIAQHKEAAGYLEGMSPDERSDYRVISEIAEYTEHDKFASHFPKRHR